MKNSLRSKEQDFADFESIGSGENSGRHPKKRAKATIQSADTKSQKAAATRARKNAASTDSRERSSTPRTVSQKKQGVTQTGKKPAAGRSRSSRGH
jgi:hypothetical protein